MDPAKLPKNFDQVTFWSSWSISLMVTISNGFLQLFSLDKNYFNYALVVEQLKTEGWQFFGLSGKYEEYPKHDTKAYKEFCKAIESIKRNKQRFSNNTNLFESGYLDSFDVLEVITNIEKVFKKKIDISKIKNFKLTVNNLNKIMKK